MNTDQTPQTDQTTQLPAGLEKPIIPINFVRDVMICNGADVLGDAIWRGGQDRKALNDLFQAVMWASAYSEGATAYNGLVLKIQNEDAIEFLVSALQAMETLGAF